jgi:hypothetical protein
LQGVANGYPYDVRIFLENPIGLMSNIVRHFAGKKRGFEVFSQESRLTHSQAPDLGKVQIPRALMEILGQSRMKKLCRVAKIGIIDRQRRRASARSEGIEKQAMPIEVEVEDADIPVWERSSNISRQATDP